MMPLTCVSLCGDRGTKFLPAYTSLACRKHRCAAWDFAGDKSQSRMSKIHYSHDHPDTYPSYIHCSPIMKESALGGCYSYNLRVETTDHVSMIDDVLHHARMEPRQMSSICARLKVSSSY
jgi:hypothetical protein